MVQFSIYVHYVYVFNGMSDGESVEVMFGHKLSHIKCLFSSTVGCSLSWVSPEGLKPQIGEC